MNIELGSLIALLMLIIVIVGHLCGTVWWMSKITTKLDIFIDSLREMQKDQKDLVHKSDCSLGHSRIDKLFEDVWDAINRKADK